MSAPKFSYPPSAGGGGGAPTTASYVVIGLDGTLSAERVLTAGTGITLTDGGANGNATLALSEVTNSVSATVVHATTNTVLADVTGLLIPIGASATEVWEFKARLVCLSTGVTADWKWGWTGPAAATMSWNCVGDNAMSTPSATPNMLGIGDTLSGGGGNGTTVVELMGVIYGGGTSGNIQLQFAQNASSAQTTNVLRGSFIRATRLFT